MSSWDASMVHLVGRRSAAEAFRLGLWFKSHDTKKFFFFPFFFVFLSFLFSREGTAFVHAVFKTWP